MPYSVVTAQQACSTEMVNLAENKFIVTVPAKRIKQYKTLTGLALADRQFVISKRISQMTKRNVTAFVNLTKVLKRLINSMFVNVVETNCL